MELLRVENLSKTYGKGEAAVRALRDVSFSMERGEFAAVVGESGSGKSTLLNCIGGLDAPTGGKVYLDGEDLFSMTENKRTIFRRQNIGFIFQSFHLIEELDVEQNIIFPCFWTIGNQRRGRWRSFWSCWGSQRDATICRGSSPAGSSRGWPSAGPWSCAHARAGG